MTRFSLHDMISFDEDIDIVINNAIENGVTKIILPAIDSDSFERQKKLSALYSDIFYQMIGVHPTSIKENYHKELDLVYSEIATNTDVYVAIGEIGLDYYWEKEEDAKKNQRDWFIKQLQLAREIDKPVIIHSREAAADTLDIMKQEWADRKAVIHCYSYSAEMAKIYAKMGYYFGIGGVLTYKNARTLVETVEYVSIEQLLLETDCPYLSPVPNRGKRNDSSNLRYVAEKIAEIKNMSYDAVVEITELNAKRFFFGEK